MMFYPPRFHTWIALRGAPFQIWCRTEIYRLVQRFDYPINIYPYTLPSGQFRELRLVIEGEHPRDIHKNILFREGDYATLIEVHIHRWVKVINGPPSPPPDRHDRRGDQRGQKRNRNERNIQLHIGGSSEASNDTPPTSGVNVNTIQYQGKQMKWVLKDSSAEKKKEQGEILRASDTINGGSQEDINKNNNEGDAQIVTKKADVTSKSKAGADDFDSNEAKTGAIISLSQTSQLNNHHQSSKRVIMIGGFNIQLYTGNNTTVTLISEAIPTYSISLISPTSTS
jgi:hypothetical protein